MKKRPGRRTTLAALARESEHALRDMIRRWQALAPSRRTNVLRKRVGPREGNDERWDAKGPEQYRLTLSVPRAALTASTPLEVHFLWDGKIMSIAGGAPSAT